MPRIKIKELPVITSDDIIDSHIMVVETAADTYQASITDMKKVFSCDAKLSAIVDTINGQLDEIRTLIDTNNSSAVKEIQEINDAIGIIQNNITSLTSRMKTAEGTIEIHNVRLSSLESADKKIISRLDENDTMNETQNANLERLNQDNETNKLNINRLIQTDSDHDNHLQNIDSTLKEHKGLIDSNKEANDEMDTYLNDRIQKKYMELLSIIDFYHHLTHDNDGNVVLDDGETTVTIEVNG